MRNKGGGDASFLMGLVLGIFVGAAVAIILSPDLGEEYRTLITDRADKALTTLEGKADRAQDRVLGASEGASPPGETG
jgi:gas vesicle protein